MERNILDLKYDLTFVYHSDDMFKMIKLKGFIEKFGQFKDILIAEVDGEFWVVDGDDYLEALKDDTNDVTLSITCKSLGVMTRDEYLAARLFLTAKQDRLNYIDIAKAVIEYKGKNLANITTLNRDDVEKYKNLLTFDWDAFLKAPVGDSSQATLFDDER